MPAFNNSGYRDRADIGGASRITLANGIITELNQAGWSAGPQRYAYSVGTLGGVPGNGAAVTIGSITYTFRTEIDNGVAYEVLIGDTVADCIDNLRHCVNDDSIGKGTLYSNATTINPNVTAGVVTGEVDQIEITANSVGIPGNTYATSGTLTWPKSETSFGGDSLQCPATPAGLSFKVHIYLDAENVDNVFIEVTGPAESFGANENAGQLETAGGRNYVMITHRYGFWLGVEGAKGAFVEFQCGTIRVFDNMLANKVAAATNSPNLTITDVANTTPIEVTTDGAHSYVSGGKAYVHGCSLEAANGYWDITVIDPTTFSLDGSTAAGTANDGGVQLQIVVTSESVHGALTGEAVWIVGVTGNINANGVHTITKIDGSSFWLNNSYPNGDYSPDPGDEALLANKYQVAECWWMNQTAFSLTGGSMSFRNAEDTLAGGSTQGVFQQRINQYTISRDLGATAGHAELAVRDVDVLYPGAKAIIFRPLLSLDQDIGGSTHEWVGELWDCVLMNRSYSQDLKAPFGGYQWQQWFAGSTSSLFLVYAEGE